MRVRARAPCARTWHHVPVPRKDLFQAVHVLARPGDRGILALDDIERGSAAEPAWRSDQVAGDTTLSARYLGTIIQGLDLARLGLTDSALQVTAPAIIDDSSGAIGSAFARTVLHVHRGRWQQAQGRAAAADGSWLYYENSHLRGYPDGNIQAGEVDAVFSVHLRLLRAELWLAEGDSVRACAFARRVRELWSDADDALSPFRLRAERIADRCH